jgi:hypothetical protein
MSLKLNNIEILPDQLAVGTGVGIASADGTLHVHTATAGTIAANADADDLVVENSGNAGITILSGNTSECNIFFGDDGDNDIGYIQYQHSNNCIVFGANAGARARIYNNGFFIGETANDDMTQGITINQGGNDDDILSFKSSDVTHGVTDLTETDTYAYFQKRSAATGGLKIGAFNTTSTQPFLVEAHSDTQTTTKSTSGVAPVTLSGFKTSGSGYTNSDDGANLLCVRTRIGGGYNTVAIIDENGEIHTTSDQTSGLAGTFDQYDDAFLVRAFDAVKYPRDIIKSKWDEFVKYNEKDLVDCGILGDTLENGGLVNITRLQRLHNGAIWQTRTQVDELREIIHGLCNKIGISFNDAKLLAQGV